MKRLLLPALLAVSFLAGCGVTTADYTDDGSTEETLQDGEALSTTRWSYVTIRVDPRACPAPMCGGYFVKDVNRSGAEQYVTGLNLAPAHLDSASAAAISNGEDVILRGRLETAATTGYRFRVLEAFRGLPGKPLAAGDGFFKVTQLTNIRCVRAPCPATQTTRLNHGTVALLDGVQLDRAASGSVDENWLLDRVLFKGALVAAHTVTRTVPGVGDLTLLDSANVYFKLPETITGCPQVRLAQCPAGQTWAFTRDENRCVLPTSCVPDRMCTGIRPGCEAGYTAQMWADPCTTWRCDPTWTLPAEN